MSDALNELIKDLVAKKAKLTKANTVVDKLKKEVAESTDRLMAAMDAVGTLTAATRVKTATINETELANVKDWDKYHAWLRKQNRLYMLERRPAQAAFREYLENSRGHKPPPGVEVFKKRTISLTSKKEIGI